jgi:hypothetical protein
VYTVALLLPVIAMACSGKDAAKRIAPADSATMVAVRAESANAAAVAARPKSQLWDVGRVSERLVRAGVAPRRIEPAPQVPAFFSAAIASAAFNVGKGGELRVFIFADSAARRKTTDALDTTTASPRGAPSVWPQPPRLIVGQNFAGIMMGGTVVLKERVQLALEAGLPRQ